MIFNKVQFLQQWIPSYPYWYWHYCRLFKNTRINQKILLLWHHIITTMEDFMRANILLNSGNYTFV